jgi:uncharacterized membrane protein
VVHFAIALVFVGVAFRVISLTGRLQFTNAAATTLILLGTLASFVAVQSGTAAHGPVERIPGVRSAVVEHEEWGERARNIFLVVSVIELAALAMFWRTHRAARGAAIAAAFAGLIGLGVMYEAAEHGGDLVYGYAGGVGIRSGNREDVNRLFIAGTYQQALQDRNDGRSEQAMALIDSAAARFPGNIDLQLTAVEWTTDVKKDAAAALRQLDALQIPSDPPQLRVRAGLIRAGVLSAQGNVDGARGVLQTLLGEYPENAQIKRRLERLTATPR